MRLLRVIFFIGNLVLTRCLLRYRTFLFLSMFFTNWAMWLTILYFGLLIIIQYKNNSLSLLALHHILFQITLVCNIIVVLIYWTLLYKIDMARPELAADRFRRWLNRTIHIWPFLGTSCNYKFSKLKMREKDGWMLAPICVAYALTNYAATLHYN